MELKIPKEPKKAKVFDFCEREDISEAEIAKQREKLRVILKLENWASHRVEKFELRWKWLSDKLADDHPETKEYLKNEPKTNT